MKILAAVDGSPYTKRMLAYLAAHDEWLGAQHEYTVLHAVQPLPGRAAAVIGRDALKAYYADAAEKVFKPIRTFFARQGIRATFEAKVDQPAEAVVARAAKGGFDLIVMGSRGHGSLVKLMLGSVATKVLAETQVPVLLVR